MHISAFVSHSLENNMKKFNIRKVLDGLTAASSSSSSAAAASPQSGNDMIQETLQSEHFQLCKTVRHGFPYQPSSMAFDPVQKILAIGTQSGALRLYPFHMKIWQLNQPNLLGEESVKCATVVCVYLNKGNPPTLLCWKPCCT
nr:syntaxin-binding protein 5 isoform X7 [Danio rerio]|eukprot:XP_021328752.1 syntaxin-binding protein 5 isoform X7 [Danio rerio]